jgi:hypothetical protein
MVPARCRVEWTIMSATAQRGAGAGARREAGGLLAIFALACAYLSPCLKDGASFGTFDFVIPLTGLGRSARTPAGFNVVNSDVVSQMNAWNGLDWLQLHAGHFPLWNDLSLNGLPQFLNFESAVLSLPDLVSYLVPLRLAFIVAVFVKMLIAGFGAYVLARVMGLGPLGASFAGVSYMLSGAFSNWLSWPLADVVAWAGWILAFLVLSYRFPWKMRWVIGLAVSVAFCMYGGFPEANVYVACALAVVIVVFCAAATIAKRGEGADDDADDDTDGRLLSMGGTAGCLAGAVAGVLFSLPLWWPGVSAIESGHRATESGYSGLPAHSLSLLLAPGYYGLPTRSNPFFLAGSNYYQSVSYVGVVMVILAVVGAVAYRRQTATVALVGLSVVILVVSWQPGGFHPVQSVLDHLAGQVQWARFRTLLGLPLGLLGGAGLQSIASGLGRFAPAAKRRRDLTTFFVMTVLLSLPIAYLALQSPSGVARSQLAAATAVRDRSLIWPVLSLVGCYLLVGAGIVIGRARDGRARAEDEKARRSRHAAAWATVLFALPLWAGNAGFLLFSGVGINAYSHTYYGTTSAITHLRAEVGSALVGLDTGHPDPADAQQFTPVGFYPEVNVGYRVALFAGHDPLIPEEWFKAFHIEVGGPGFFEPDIDSLALARRYGISYVLSLPAVRPIPGALLVASYGGELLYKIPGAKRFSVGGNSRILSTRHRSPGEYDLSVVAGHGGTELTARITDVPGWRASIDGRAVALHRSGGVLLGLRVPAGHHRIVLRYWPDGLTEGIWAAIAGGAGLLLLAVFTWTGLLFRRRQVPARELFSIGGL